LLPVTNWLAAQSKATQVLLGIIGCGLVALLDYQTGYTFNVVLFYFFPILFVAWNVGRTAGIALGILSSVAWFAVNALTAPPGLPTAVHLWNAGMRFAAFVGGAYFLSFLRSITERAALANVDHLTGVANMRAFEKLARGEIRRSLRYRHPLTVAYVDLDDFKALNDTLGHKAGDEALRQTAALVARSLRQSDSVARIGGDEFIVLMPETDYEAADRTLHRLQRVLLAKMQENLWPVTFSIGAVTFSVPPQSVEEVVSAADRVMYIAKKSGKNGIRHEKVGESGWPAHNVA